MNRAKGEVAIGAESNHLEADGADRPPLRKVARVFIRRKWLWACCLIVAMSAGVTYLKTAAPVVETSLTVYVQSLSQSIEGAAAPDGVLSVQPSIMRSAPVASVAMLSPGVRDLRMFKGESDPIGVIESRLAVRALAKPGVYSLTYTSSTPDDAEKLLNAIVASYINYQTIQQQQSVDRLQTDLQQQRQKTEQDLAAAKQRLSDTLKHQEEAAPTEQTLRQMAQQRAQAAAALADARQATDDARVAYDKAAQQLGGEEKLKQAARSGSPDPSAKNVAAVVTKYLAALAQQGQLQKHFDELEKQSDAIDSVDEELTRLQSESQRLISQDTDLSDRLNHWDRAQDNQVAISILKPAETDHTPIWPRTMPVLGIAAGAWILLSLVFSRLMDWAHVKLQNAEDAARYAGAPILGRLEPMPWELTTQMLRGQCVLLKPSDVSAIALEDARYALEKVMAPNFYKTVLVTSLATSQGKSLLASNLAISMAQSGLRVILMDTNYARPAMNEIYGIEDQVGLSDAIEGSIDAVDALHRTELESLQILPVGRADANWPDLLNQPEFETVLSDLMECCDRLVIDGNTATLNECLYVAAFCDATVMLVDPRRSKRRSLRSVAERLRSVGARIVGLVLNDVPKVRRAQARMPLHQIGDLRSELVGPGAPNRDVQSTMPSTPVQVDDEDAAADAAKMPMPADADVDEAIDVWGLKLP